MSAPEDVMADVLADPPVEALKAIAHPLRFRILETLTAGERNVGEIEAATGIGQPALSQQLAVLRAADLVVTRKQAKLVYYALARNRLAVLAAVLEALAGRPVAAAPVERQSPSGVAAFARIKRS